MSQSENQSVRRPVKQMSFSSEHDHKRDAGLPAPGYRTTGYRMTGYRMTGYRAGANGSTTCDG